MIRFARNLLVVLFAAVAVFALTAGPANASTARTHTAWATCGASSHNGSVRGHLIMLGHSKPQRSCRAPYASLVTPYIPRYGYGAWNIYYISQIQP
jgi:hypothetical protein